MRQFNSYKSQLEDEGVDVSREPLGYTKILFKNILNITTVANLAAMSLFTSDFKVVYNSYHQAVNILENLLAPYIDETYKKEIQEIEQHETDITDRNSVKKLDIFLKYKFRSLMRLMERKNLLLEETITEEI